MSSVEVGDECEKGGFTFIWRIENFRHCVVTKGNYIQSTYFYSADLNTTWYLYFYPRGYTDATKSQCDLRRTSAANTISFDCEMCICTTNGERLYVCKEFHKTINERYSCSSTLFNKSIDDHFPHDTLILHCHLWKVDSARSGTSVYCHFITKIKVQKKTFLWKIAEFSSLLLKNENCFILKKVENESPNLTFKLSLSGKTVGDASVQIVIHFEGLCRKTFFTFSIFLVDNTGTATKFMNDEYWLESGSHKEVFPHFLTRRELVANKTSFLPNDELCLKCEVTLSDDNHTIEQVVHGESTREAVDLFQKRLPSFKQQILEDNSSNNLQGDLGRFYDSTALCDLKLSAGGRAFPVHRNILSARSPVFKAMFENDMLEKTTTSLDLPDLDPDTLDRMLRYVYTDAVPDMQWKDATRLYFAADKYQLLALRARCSTLLQDRLDVSNAAEILALADRHHDEDLKWAVQDFVFSHGRTALNADEWKLLEAENPQVALETLRKILYEIILAPPLNISVT